MSLKAANDFIDKANRDESLRKEARESVKAKGNYKDMASVGRKHGYEFTHEELGEAFRQRKAGAKSDMADAQCQCHFTDESSGQCQCHFTE